MPFFTFFFLFSACFACQTRSKNRPKVKLRHFERDLTVLWQNPFNAILWLCFSLSRGRFFPVKSNLSIDYDWTGLNRKNPAWAALPRCPIIIFKMQYLEHAFAAMLALSTVNCPILKVINYCELYNTQAALYTVILLTYAELQFLACMYDLKTLLYIDIQCFAAPNALWLRSIHCNTALRSFSTQHCKSQ